MDITGILKEKKQTEKVNDKFSKREFILTDNSNIQYPQHILFQLTQDKCKIVDAISVGSEIKVYFNLRGREWTNTKTGEVKYFNTLEAWRIETLQNLQVDTGNETPEISNEITDDLPF